MLLPHPLRYELGLKKKKNSSKPFTVSSPSPKGLTSFLELQHWQKRRFLFILSRNTPLFFQENRIPPILKVATYLTADRRIYRVAKGTIWRRQWHPTPVLLPGKYHGQRSLVGYSPWGLRESDTTSLSLSLRAQSASHTLPHQYVRVGT